MAAGIFKKNTVIKTRRSRRLCAHSPPAEGPAHMEALARASDDKDQ
jgi:hypothetical protein